MDDHFFGLEESTRILKYLKVLWHNVSSDPIANTNSSKTVPLRDRGGKSCRFCNVDGIWLFPGTKSRGSCGIHARSLALKGSPLLTPHICWDCYPEQAPLKTLFSGLLGSLCLSFNNVAITICKAFMELHEAAVHSCCKIHTCKGCLDQLA